ncbi:MAG: carboxymuconolactone decarboxylase family protein [Candidatus Binatia bacterium]
MPRLPELNEAKLSPQQKVIYDDIMRVRGRVRGPFAVWLRNAELAEGALKLQDMFAARVQMERRLIQLMILVAARFASAQYAWHIHEPHALQHGISPAIVEAIRERRTPDFIREDERLVYDITLELNTTQRLSDTTFGRGMALFGEQQMVELVSGVGFYAMVALTLNAFDVEVPDGKKPLG